MLLTSETTTTTVPTTRYMPSPYAYDQFGYHKHNELYSIFVSMFTAALFLLFIMWRWVRIKSDLRKALREQAAASSAQNNDNNNQSSNSLLESGGTCGSPGGGHEGAHTTMMNLPPPPRLNTSSSSYNAFLIAQHTDNLRSLIGQLTNGVPRTAEEHQRIINAAKNCLQQLKQQTGLDGEQTICQYYLSGSMNGGGSFNGRTSSGGRPHSGYTRYLNGNNGTGSRSHNNHHHNHHNHNATNTNHNNRITESHSASPIQTVPAQAVALQNTSQVYNLIDNSENDGSNSTARVNNNKIELPPAYDSLMSKSSSLPSYHNVATNGNKLTVENNK
jgi:hypothetical protein